MNFLSINRISNRTNAGKTTPAARFWAGGRNRAAPGSPPSGIWRRLNASAALLAGCGLSMLTLSAAGGTSDGEATAVSSKVSDDYVRGKLPSGDFAPETYAFGEGGAWTFAKDDTIDKLHFLDVARTVAAPLARQNYVPAREPAKTKLLIMVYWGTTAGTSAGASSSIAYQNLAASQQIVAPTVIQLPNGATVSSGTGGDVRKSAQTIDENAVFMLAVANHQRERSDIENARLLGYDEALANASGLESTALRFRKNDLLDEIEEDRYFVVLMAYDFQLLWKEKKHKLLWETRFSIREQRNDFGKQLAAMAESASKYFGQDSHGIVRKPLPEGRVEIGNPTFIDYEPEKK